MHAPPTSIPGKPSQMRLQRGIKQDVPNTMIDNNTHVLPPGWVSNLQGHVYWCIMNITQSWRVSSKRRAEGMWKRRDKPQEHTRLLTILLARTACSHPDAFASERTLVEGKEQAQINKQAPSLDLSPWPWETVDVRLTPYRATEVPWLHHFLAQAGRNDRLLASWLSLQAIYQCGKVTAKRRHPWIFIQSEAHVKSTSV